MRVLIDLDELLAASHHPGMAAFREEGAFLSRQREKRDNEEHPLTPFAMLAFVVAAGFAVRALLRRQT